MVGDRRRVHIYREILVDMIWPFYLGIFAHSLQYSTYNLISALETTTPPDLQPLNAKRKPHLSVRCDQGMFSFSRHHIINLLM